MVDLDKYHISLMNMYVQTFSHMSKHFKTIPQMPKHVKTYHKNDDSVKEAPAYCRSFLDGLQG